MFCDKVTPELRRAMDEFERRFGEGEIVPLEMINDDETTEGLLKNIQKCFEANKNLLPEIYGWANDPPYIMY